MSEQRNISPEAVVVLKRGIELAASRYSDQLNAEEDLKEKGNSINRKYYRAHLTACRESYELLNILEKDLELNIKVEKAKED